MRKIALPILIALLTVNCGGDVDENSENINAGAIKIGVVGDIFESPFNSTGQAALMARDEINDAGGINGVPVEIIARDGSCDSMIGPQEVEKLVEQYDIVALIGPACSSEAAIVIENLLPLYLLPTVSNTATSPLLTTLDTRDLFFRVQPSDAIVIESIYEEVIADGIERLGIIYRGGNDVFNSAIAEGLADKFAQSPGKEVVALVPYPEQATVEFSTEVKTLFDAGSFDGLAIVGFGIDTANVSTAIAQEMQRRGILRSNLQQVYLTNSDASVQASGSGFLLEGGKLIQIVGNSAVTAPHLATWVQRFRARFPESGDGDAYGYDAMYLISLAMLNAGIDSSHSNAQIRNAIQANVRAVSGTGAPDSVVKILPGQFALASQTVSSGGAIDYDGATGVIEFDNAGDIQYGEFQVASVSASATGLTFHCSRLIRLFPLDTGVSTEIMACP